MNWNLQCATAQTTHLDVPLRAGIMNWNDLLTLDGVEIKSLTSRGTYELKYIGKSSIQVHRQSHIAWDIWIEICVLNRYFCSAGVSLRVRRMNWNEGLMSDRNINIVPLRVDTMNWNEALVIEKDTAVVPLRVDTMNWNKAWAEPGIELPCLTTRETYELKCRIFIRFIQQILFHSVWTLWIEIWMKWQFRMKRAVPPRVGIMNWNEDIESEMNAYIGLTLRGTYELKSEYWYERERCSASHSAWDIWIEMEL